MQQLSSLITIKKLFWRTPCVECMYGLWNFDTEKRCNYYDGKANGNCCCMCGGFCSIHVFGRSVECGAPDIQERPAINTASLTGYKKFLRSTKVELSKAHEIMESMNKISDEEVKNFYHMNPIVVNEGISIRLMSMFDVIASLEIKSNFDIGCGAGHLVAWMRRKGYQSSGIDISCDHIKAAKEKYPNIDVSCESVFEVQIPDVDLITMTDVLEHIRSDDHRSDDHRKLFEKLGKLRVGTLLYMNQPSATAVINLHSQIIDNPIPISHIVDVAKSHGWILQFFNHWHMDYYHIVFMRDNNYD